MAQNKTLQLDQGILETLLVTIRRKKVLLDHHVAELYGVPTREVNRAVKNNPEKFLKGYVTDWNASLPQSLDTSVASSPYFNVFLASQVKANDKGFLSKDVLVGDLIALRGDIHHLFPRDYLKKNGLNRSKYNQIANYVYMQSEINIKVGNKPLKEYFMQLRNEILDNKYSLSGISNEEELLNNLKSNCVPPEIMEMEISDYETFLTLRCKLMARKIKEYYFSL